MLLHLLRCMVQSIVIPGYQKLLAGGPALVDFVRVKLRATNNGRFHA